MAGEETNKTDDVQEQDKRTTPEIQHTPIIITDGSASVEFDRTEYTHVGSGRHTSNGLHLDRIEARRVNNPTVVHVCHQFAGNVAHRIEVTCAVNAGRTDILITGAREGGARSPVIIFARDSILSEDPQVFPPKFATGRRFGNGAVRVISFRVINLATDEIVHDCELASRGRFEYTIYDDHG